MEMCPGLLINRSLLERHTVNRAIQAEFCAYYTYYINALQHLTFLCNLFYFLAFNIF